MTLIINNNFLLNELKGCTEEYWPKVSTARLYRNNRGPIFSSIARLVRSDFFLFDFCNEKSDWYHFTDLSTLVTDEVHVFGDTCYKIITKISLASSRRGN